VRNAVPSCCAHCGADVPAGLVRQVEQEQFCCNGCRTAYEILHGAGLDEFYGIRDRCGTGSPAVEDSSHSFEFFEDPAFIERHVTRDSRGRCHVRLGIASMHCAACVWLLEKLPNLVIGVTEARANIARSALSVTWDNTATSLGEIAAVLARLGYAPHPLDASDNAAQDAERRRQLIRIGVAGACAGNAMLIALALYAGMLSGMSPEFLRLFRLTGTAIGIIAICWPGAVFFRGAWAALRTRTPHMDVPVSLGLAVGGAAGTVNAITGSGETYFDTLALLVFLLLVGRYLLYCGRRKAIERVSLLNSLTPRIARLIEADGHLRSVSADTLRCGDVVEVRAGDLIAGDGQVIAGQSSIDEGLLTGEALPRVVTVGAEVPAGATNLTARIAVRITAVGASSRIGHIMGLVEDAAGRKPQWVLFADRISSGFVGIVLTLAAITAAAWWSVGPAAAINHTAALLIVACPCALGLATPLTLAVALGRAARSGILIKSPQVSEQVARGGRIWLDKTGTITEGRMSVRDWIGSEDVKPLVVAFESQVVHPIADALTRAWADVSEEPPIDDFEPVLGSGVRGISCGRMITIGSERFLRSSGIEITPEIACRVPAWLNVAWTPVLIAIGDRTVAAAAVGDTIRPGAVDAIAALRRLGWEVGILSGDHQAVVTAVAREVGVAEARGGLSPEEKLQIVRAGRIAEPVIMVGDGVNDSAALAAAAVGVAVHGGAEVSLKAADVYIARPGLTGLVDLVRGGRRAVLILRINFAASLTYNMFAVGLAMAGQINPLVAAILMPISSLTVLALALGGRTFTASADQPLFWEVPQ
jgi:Cu2+-exporting ATPase